LEVFSPEQRGILAKKVSWVEKVAWKSNIASFIVGMLVLTFGFGFMSEGTHEKLAKASTDAALRPYLAVVNTKVVSTNRQRSLLKRV